MITIESASAKHIDIIRDIAERTWWPTYSPLLSAEQIRFMLDEIYSAEALRSVMDNGSQTFLVLSDDNGPQGFASYGLKDSTPEIYKLHKLYVLPHNHGKGYGRKLIEEITKRLAELKASILDLNVNRLNPARSFYESIGFKIVGEEDVPIGPYWMNDYVMRMVL